MSAKPKNTKLVQCLLEREGGTEVDIFGITCKFLPNEKGHHVAEISSNKVYKRLMSIPEAYCDYDPHNVPTSRKNASEALAKKKYADDAPRREIAADKEADENLEDAFENDDIPDDNTEADDGKVETETETKTPDQLAKEAADKQADEEIENDPYKGISNEKLKEQIEFKTKKKVHPMTGRVKLIATLQAIEVAEKEKAAANKI